MRLTSRTLRDERGFTLIEAMLVTLLGFVLISAAYTTLDTSTAQVSEVSRRTAATQRARNAMEVITRTLRGTVCNASGAAPVAAATATSVDVWASLGDGTAVAAAAGSSTRTADKETRPKPPDRVRIALEGTELVTYTWNARWATPDSDDRVYTPALGAGDQPTATLPTRRVLDTGIVPTTAPDGSTLPFLRYYPFDADPTDATVPQLVPSATGLSSDDRPLVVRFAVAFAATPEGGGGVVGPVAVTDDVTSGTLDPADPSPTLKCAT